MPHNRPDIVAVDNSKRMCHIIDVACPGDSRIALKEEERSTNTITPVVGALASYTERLEKFLDGIHVGLRTDIIQKTALLGSARILRKSFGMLLKAVCYCPTPIHQSRTEI